MDQTTPKLGTFLEPHDSLRDAVHMAVAPVIAALPLNRGQRIGLVGVDKRTGCPLVGPCEEENIGIVDPLLPRDEISVGEKFYIWLYPQTITSLRHVWTHPAFVNISLKAQKEILDGLGIL